MLITAGHFWLHSPHRFNPGGNGIAYLHGYATNSLGDSRYNNSSAFGNLAAIPQGASGQTAWVPPRRAGGMSSHNEIQGTSTASAIPISLQGLIDGTCTVSGTVAAILLMAGASDGTSTAELVKGAKGWLIGESDGVTTVSLASHAYGELVGSITPFTELSPENLASAVWSQAIEAGYSAAEIIRILAAFAAGSATGLEGSDPQFTGIDGVTLRIDGAYSGGTRTIDSLNGA